jgi:hypothetical protein
VDEIVALEEQRYLSHLRQSIDKQIAKVQIGGVPAAPPIGHEGGGGCFRAGMDGLGNVSYRVRGKDKVEKSLTAALAGYGVRSAPRPPRRC